MGAHMKTSLAISLVAHLGIFVWAGSAATPMFTDGGRMPTTGAVVMAELVPPPEPAADPPIMETSPEPSSTAPEETPVPAEEETAVAAKVTPSTENVPSGDGIRGKQLNWDSARMDWVRNVVAKTMKYQRNAPKGFEEMVRAALALHPVDTDGTAMISFRNDPSGSAGVVILVQSDSPGLKTALDRVEWEAAPLPSRYQIPYSRLDVTVSLAGERLSVGIKIL